MPDGGGRSIRSVTASDNRKVRFARSPEVAVIATLPAMGERFDQKARFVAAFSIFVLAMPGCCFGSDPSSTRSRQFTSSFLSGRRKMTSLFMVGEMSLLVTFCFSGGFI